MVGVGIVRGKVALGELPRGKCPRGWCLVTCSALEPFLSYSCRAACKLSYKSHRDFFVFYFVEYLDVVTESLSTSKQQGKCVDAIRSATSQLKDALRNATQWKELEKHLR